MPKDAARIDEVANAMPPRFQLRRFWGRNREARWEVEGG